jgi:hypothetical protein
MTIFNTGDTAGASLTLNAGSLTTAGGLRLLNVWNLPEITGLGALRTLTSVIIIEDNPALSTLQGLATLQTAQSILSVQRNSLLPTCEAVELRDRLQSNGFDGAIVIRENLTDTCQ